MSDFIVNYVSGSVASTHIPLSLIKMKRKYSSHGYLFWLGVLLLLVPGLLHAYLLMPFPGSQDSETIVFCYYLEKFVLPLRIVGGIMVLAYLFIYFSSSSKGSRWFKVIVLILCIGSYYITDVIFSAQQMFKEPGIVHMADAKYNKVPYSYVVLGVVQNGIAKAYPLIYLGYHHKVQDNIGNQPVLITYCTMCRTGRVYSPVINGKRQTFRLVGARHYNAVIEDSATGTWWYQATGEAAAGPLKGQHLQELPYEQTTLGEWLMKYPQSLILQPDIIFNNDYADLKGYDRIQAVDKDPGNSHKDSLVRKSWIIGVIINHQAKAYNWRKLVKYRLVNDSVNSTPVLVAIEKDTATFHAWNREIDGKSLLFKIDKNGFTDRQTASVWSWDGLCTDGVYKGRRLLKIQAYQEYWHSWKHFHPATLYW